MSSALKERAVRQALKELAEEAAKAVGIVGGMKGEDILAAVERTAPRLVETVEDVVKDSLEAEDSHEDCYSWDMVREEVRSAIDNLTVGEIPESLLEEIREDVKGEGLPPCPECGFGRMEYRVITAVLCCDHCRAERRLK